MPLLSIRYTSPGYLSSMSSVYGHVLRFFSLLLQLSILMLLVITGADVHHSGDGDDTAVIAVKVVIAIAVILQLVLLVTSVVYLTYPFLTEYDTFLLTVAVTNNNGIAMTKYGATTEWNVSEQDIDVFYERVTASFRSCEPLKLPLSDWIFPGQVFSFLISMLLMILYISLLGENHSNISLVVVVFINLVQQTMLVFLAYLTSTDCGCCCPGFSVTRWFPHKDRYTQLIQSCIRQRFSETMRKPRSNKQWFNNTLVTETDTSAEEVNFDNNRRHSDIAEIRKLFRGSCVNNGDDDNRIDIGEQIKLLQNLLENVHDELYRSVIPTTTSNFIPLFLTRKEMTILDKYFINEALENAAEHVIFHAGQ